MVPALEGGFQQGVPAEGSRTERGSSKGFQRGSNGPTCLVCHRNHGKGAFAALVGSIPQLKPYTAIKGKAQAERWHHIQSIMRELLVDPEAVVVEGGGGLYIRFAGHHNDEDPRVVRAIGLWATGRRFKLSIRQMLALPCECTCCDLAEARTRLTPYSTTITINVPTSGVIDFGIVGHHDGLGKPPVFFQAPETGEN